MKSHDPVLPYLRECEAAMADAADTSTTRNGVRAFAQALETAALVTIERTSAPHLPVLESTGRLTTDLGRRLHDIADHLPWRPSPRTADDGSETAICELGQCIDLGDLRAGLTLLDARCTYPTHNHPPQELYLTISGTGWWRYGGATDEVEVAAGRVIYNHPFDWHSMTAGDEPLLALWVLWP